MELLTPVSHQCRSHVLSCFTSLACTLRPLTEVSHTDELIRSLGPENYVAMMATSRAKVLLMLIRDPSVPGSPCRCLFLHPGHWKVASARMAFDEALFQDGTVFEGELVTRVSEVWFLINDLMILHGMRPTGGLLRRRELLKQIILRGHVADPLFDDAQISVKQLCDPRDLSPLLVDVKFPWRFVTLHPCDDQPIAPAFRLTLPPRPTSHHSAPTHMLARTPTSLPVAPTPTAADAKPRMMKVRRTELPDVYEVLDKGVWNLACLPTIASSREMRHLFAQSSCSAAVIRTSCAFNKAFRGWEPVPVSFPRTDETAVGDDGAT